MSKLVYYFSISRKVIVSIFKILSNVGKTYLKVTFVRQSHKLRHPVRRHLGRPRQRLIEKVKRALQKIGQTGEDASRDMAKWRSFSKEVKALQELHRK